MIHRIPDAARDVRAWALALAVVVLAGCGSSGEGTENFSQKFEPPPEAAAKSSAPVPEHKSRREMKEEDQAQARKANQ